jgi:predicted DCC family thiol-disulfide oxidoreductase YuxK
MSDISDLIRDKTILLFDGHCNFCSSTVQFILRHEKKPQLYFCSLQSDAGRSILEAFRIDPSQTDSLVLVEKGRAYVRSSAALRLSRYLRGLYPLLSAFFIIPPFIRNGAYNYIARHRYKWFGRSESCMVPQPEVKARFL